MSVINNMLKDLEKRAAPQDVVPLVHLSTQTAGVFSFSLKKILLLSIFILIFIFLLTTILIVKKKHVLPSAQSSSITDISASITPVLPPNMENVNWQKPVLITGITLQVKENLTEITFLLDHAALYRLLDSVRQNQLSLIIDNSKLQSELPPIDNLHTAIKHLAVQTIRDDTRFNLFFYPGTVIKYIDITDQDKNPQIVIGIEYHSVAAETAEQRTKLIKTPVMQSFLLQQYHDALNLAEHGHEQVAMKQLSSLLKMDPAYKDARVTLVALLIDKGEQPLAKRLLVEGLNLSPDYLPFVELEARILTNEGKVKQALTLLQTISPPINENPEYHAFIAALYERNNDNVLAANLYKQLLLINPHNSKWWLGLGVSLEKLGHPREAYAAYTRTMNEGNLPPQSAEFLQDRLHALKGVDDAAG